MDQTSISKWRQKDLNKQNRFFIGQKSKDIFNIRRSSSFMFFFHQKVILTFFIFYQRAYLVELTQNDPVIISRAVWHCNVLIAWNVFQHFIWIWKVIILTVFLNCFGSIVEYFFYFSKQ